jgi:hypothetical protein
MFTRLAKTPVVVRRPSMPAQALGFHANDNRIGRQRAERLVRRPGMACRWHVNAATGRPECRWEIDGDEGAATEVPRPALSWAGARSRRDPDFEERKAARMSRRLASGACNGRRT